MKQNTGPKEIRELLKNRQIIKPPAYEWQDLALRIIKELGIPRYKKSAVFKICKELPKSVVERAMNETKELAQRERWKYFFKVIDNKNKLDKK
ncbi:MAG: hypothetical protein AAB358_03355 [Patescibacteria group bacterium]